MSADGEVTAMTRRIAVGVDGSDTAARAAETAAQLAASFEAELLVVSAYGRFEVERLQAGSEEYVFTSEDQGHEVAERVAEELQGRYPGLALRVLAQEGKPADALVEVAERERVDVIVVGNKRVQGRGWVLGSIATDVARKAPCDVYIAHTHTRLRSS